MGRIWDRSHLVVVALVTLVFLGGTVAARSSQSPGAVSTLEIQELQRDLENLERRVEARDLDERYGEELADIQDEITYLRLKMNKEGRVPRTEYDYVRELMSEFRMRLDGRTGAVDTTRVGAEIVGDTIPVGAEFDVRLQSHLSSETSRVEDRFEATTVVDLFSGERVLVPAGSVMRGIVTAVDPASRLDRKGRLTVAFDRLTVQGTTYDIRSTVTEAIESEGLKGEAERIGTGAGVGAIVGGILGGFKGALAGILIGAGGTIAATEGEDVELPPGTILRVRFDAPVTLVGS